MIEARFETADAERVLKRFPWPSRNQRPHMVVEFFRDAFRFRMRWDHDVRLRKRNDDLLDPLWIENDPFRHSPFDKLPHDILRFRRATQNDAGQEAGSRFATHGEDFKNGKA